MKPDDFEKYIINNRMDFGPDHDVPDVWDKVKKRTRQEERLKLSWRHWTSIAASVLVIFTLSYFFHDYRAGLETQKSNQHANALDDPRLLQLLEADEYYTAEISYKKEELFRLASNEPGLESEINKDLADLDAVLAELKRDLGDNANNEEVIEAMMQNYRLKLEILEDMLEQFTKNQDENFEHEESFSI